MELVGRLANPVHPEKPLEDLEALVAKLRTRTATRAEPQPSCPQRRQTVLTPAQITDILTAYRAGATSGELAARYHLDKAAMLKLLRDNGVSVRYQPPTEAQITKAAALYEAGATVAEIATKLGLPHTTVANHLRKRGVVLRSRGRAGQR